MYEIRAHLVIFILIKYPKAMGLGISDQNNHS